MILSCLGHHFFFQRYLIIVQEGTLVERRLHQRKWKWVVHGSPEHQTLTSITPPLQDESWETFISLFFTSSAGSVFEYQMPKQLGQSSNCAKSI